ncbi:MAG: DUF1045 domain-containing protein [Aestuariivirga sp.]
MRHAIYYAPARGSQLHELGSSWLGRDVFTGDPVRQPAFEGIREATAEPHRYGFHATLKAPFTMRQGLRRIDLGDAVSALAAGLDAISGIRLNVRHVDGFIALVPERADERIANLAAICVKNLDPFRAAAGDDEVVRRRGLGLSQRQELHLRDWGYPYVLDEFRFHITLTRRVSETEALVLLPAALAHFRSVLRNPIAIDALTIFAEAIPSGDFIVEERFPLRAVFLAKAAS